jgi:hypothetical protein
VVRGSSAGAMQEFAEIFDFAALTMAEYLNTSIHKTAVDGAYNVSSVFNPAAEWSDTATATPFHDLKNFSRDFKNDIYRLTDVIGHENSYYEIGDYITDRDSSSYVQARVYGLPTYNGDTIKIPSIGDFHNFGTDIDDGYLLGLDRNHSALEYHYYNDPDYSQATVTYEAMINGQLEMVNIKNIGINYRVIEDKNNDDSIMKFWVEQKTIVTRPRGLLYLGVV